MCGQLSGHSQAVGFCKSDGSEHELATQSLVARPQSQLPPPNSHIRALTPSTSWSFCMTLDSIVKGCRVRKAIAFTDPTKSTSL